MNTILLMSLPLLLLVAVPTEQCKNFRGETEACGELQFCSTANTLERGCRNCTDIYEKWCDERRIAEFKTKYPKCGILCGLQRLEDELSTEKERNHRLSGEKENLETIRLVLSVALGVSVLLAMALACLLVRQKAQSLRASRNAEGTATPEHPGVWKRLVSCLWIRVRGPQPASPDQNEEAIALDESRV